MLTGFSLSVLALATEESGSLIDVNPGLIFWTVVTFLVLLVILPGSIGVIVPELLHLL